MLIVGIGSMWATEVTWESKSGWVQASGGKGALKWFGAMTPGTTDMEYTLDEFQVMHEVKANDNQNCYIAIAKSSATSSLNASEVIAVSNNRILPAAVQLYTYEFDETVTLKGGTTYYIVFLTSNTPTDGAYPVGEGRMAVNHNTYGTYTPGTSYSNSWWPYYKATLTTEDPLTDYNYTCKNLAGYELGVSGVYSQTSAPTADQAPIISGYSYSSINVDGTNVTYTYSLTTNPLSSLTTAAANIDSNPTYIILASIVSTESSTFYYFADSDGKVKGNFDQSTKEDATHWIIVGDETNGYKLYNARFGSEKVAQTTSGNDEKITLVDAASNDGTLFDLRYISGAYRFYLKGTQYCTNRVSSPYIGINENVNSGSETTIFRYYANALYKQSDINTAKTYTIKSGARGYIFVNASGYVANNHGSTAESAAEDADYQWAFVQAANGKYYLYNVGKEKFVGSLATDGGRAAVSNLSTTDYVYLTSTKSTSYYPLYLTGIGYNSSYADVSAKYINTQGNSGSNNSVVYNSYNTLDGGNDFLITELNDFSSDDILDAKVALHNQAGGAFPAEFTAAAKATVQGAPAQLYTIKGKLGTLEANSDGTYLTNTGKSSSTVAPSTDTKQQWALFYVSDNSYLLYNVGAEKYLSSDGSNNYALVEDRASASAIQFRASTTGGSGSTAGFMLNYPAGIGIGSAWLNLNNNNTSSFPYGTTTYNHAEDINNMFRIEPIDGKTLNIDIKYNLIWNGEPIKTQDASVGYGSAPVSPWNAPAYCSLTSDVETIDLSTTEVNVTLNWNGPFEISSDFEHAKWRYLKMHGQYLIYSGSSTTPNSLDDLATAEDAGYNAFWAFVGDPFNGFQLINKAAGSDKNLTVTGWYPNMDTSETKWLLQQWGNYFALRTSSYYYLNNADGQLKLWVSGTSAEATNFDCTIESASYRGLALDFIDDYANSHALGHYFGVSTSTYNSVRASYADAASVSESDYTQLVTYIGGMLPASYPETGYYRIKSNSGRYIGYGQPVADPMPSVGLRTVSAEDAATDVSTIFRLVKGVGNHQYTLSTEGLNVQSMKSSNTPFPATNDVGATFVLTASTTNPGKGTIYNAASNDDGSEYINGYLHEANWSVPGVINWHAGSTSSQWEIEDATSFSGTLTNANDNTGTGHSYATLCVPFAISSITGASAYAPTKDGNYLVMGNALESTIAAGTPVMLVGATNAGSYTANIEANTAPVSSPIDTYALKGTFTGTSIDCTKQTGTNYVLGFDKNNDNRIGFYHVNSSSYSLKANRAYLNLTGGDARGYNIMFDVDDDATGIVSTPGETEEGTTIYNLSGQRLNKMQKGINIVNGKKVLF